MTFLSIASFMSDFFLFLYIYYCNTFSFFSPVRISDSVTVAEYTICICAFFAHIYDALISECGLFAHLNPIAFLLRRTITISSVAGKNNFTVISVSKQH